MQKHLNNESIFYNPAHKTKYRISMLWKVPSTSPLILTSHKSPLYNPANNILSWYEEAIIPTIYPIIPLLQLHHHYIPFYTHYILIIPSLFISSLYPHYIKIMYALYLSIRMIIPFHPLSHCKLLISPFCRAGAGHSRGPPPLGHWRCAAEHRSGGGGNAAAAVRRICGLAAVRTMEIYGNLG